MIEKDLHARLRKTAEVALRAKRLQKIRAGTANQKLAVTISYPGPAIYLNFIAKE
jgi:hypothetical protein